MNSQAIRLFNAGMKDVHAFLKEHDDEREEAAAALMTVAVRAMVDINGANDTRILLAGLVESINIEEETDGENKH